jgi:hypothetical protein
MTAPHGPDHGLKDTAATRLNRSPAGQNPEGCQNAENPPRNRIDPCRVQFVLQIVFPFGPLVGAWIATVGTGGEYGSLNQIFRGMSTGF